MGMRIFVFILAFFVGLQFMVQINSFTTCRISHRLGAHVISMAGGRSLDEKQFTNRQLFRQLRDKLNTASTQPGFFDDVAGDVKVRMDLS
jgi:hypothetical protein